MTWIVIILGLAGNTPTFRGPYDLADCRKTATHVNTNYSGMVHAKCITAWDAKTKGWVQK